MPNLLREYIRNKLIEQASNKGSLIVVDIQPEYESGATFDIGDMLRAAAEYNEVLFLYNGADTLGMIDEQSLRNYYFEKLDYDEETYEELMSVSEFFDKGYGFFRDVMDSDICFDRNSVIKIVKYMIDNDVQDIRDLEEEDVQSIGVSELLFDDLEDYGFWVPELQDVLPQWNGSDIAGGARNECLAEVEILAAAQGLSFRQVNEFIYEGDTRYTEGMLSEDFGEKVWATKAPENSRHRGDEPDTEIESSLYTAIKFFLNKGDTTLWDQRRKDAFDKATTDPRYNDVFKYETSGKLYRGMRIGGPWDVERDYGIPDSEWMRQLNRQTSPKKVRGVLKNMSEMIPTSTVYEPVTRSNGFSSWTPDFSVAKKFASQVRDGQSNTEMGIILVADASGGKFLDMTAIYGFAGLNRYQGEEERISIGSVQLEGVYFIQPNKTRWWI